MRTARHLMTVLLLVGLLLPLVGDPSSWSFVAAQADDAVSADVDSDGIGDDIDNCVDTANADQLDTDADSTGDVCDPTPFGETDTDGAGLPNAVDPTPYGDSDGDGIDELADPYLSDDPTQEPVDEPAEAVEDAGNTLADEWSTVTVYPLPDVSLTFDRVTASGQTDAWDTAVDALPAGYRTDNARAVDITTTASFAGQVIACVLVQPGAFSDPDAASLFWSDGSGWTDITDRSQSDPWNGMLCGYAPALGRFVVAEPAPAPSPTSPPVATEPPPVIAAEIPPDVISTPTFESGGIPNGNAYISCMLSLEPGASVYVAYVQLSEPGYAVVTWSLKRENNTFQYGGPITIPPATNPVFQVDGKFIQLFMNVVYYDVDDNIVAVVNEASSCSTTPGSTWTPTPTPTPTLTPGAPENNTLPGENVFVSPIGLTGSSITFDEVVTGGNTTISPLDAPSEMPVGFRTDTFRTFDISTTATFNGAVQINLPYSPAAFDNPANVRLLHNEGGTWVDITTSNDPMGGQISGVITSFSEFGLGEVEAPLLTSTPTPTLTSTPSPSGPTMTPTATNTPSATTIPPLGKVSVELRDPDGALIVLDEEVCLNLIPTTDVDFDYPYLCSNENPIVFAEVPPSTYEINRFAPSGYRIGSDYPGEFAVTAGHTTTVSVPYLLDWTDNDYSRVLIHVVDGNGNPLSGLCIDVAESLPYRCYSSTETEPGTYWLDAPLPPGSYQYGILSGVQWGVTQVYNVFSFDVASGDGLVELTVPVESHLAVTVTDAQGNPVPGFGCLYVRSNAETGGPGVSLLWDGADGAADGTFDIWGLPPGIYTISLNCSSIDDPLDESVEIGPGLTARTYDISAYVQNDQTPTPNPGEVTLTVSIVDGNQVPIPNAWGCFDLVELDRSSCGTSPIVFDHVSGTVTLVQSDSDWRHIPMAGQMTIDLSTTHEVTVVNTLRPIGLTIDTLDESGNHLPFSACYDVRNRSTGDSEGYCDNDGDGADGVTKVYGLPAGTYDVSVVDSGIPYAFTGPQTVTVTEGETANLAFTFTIEYSNEHTRAVIQSVDSNGNPVVGACVVPSFRSMVLPELCDSDDGFTDGVLNFATSWLVDNTGVLLFIESRVPAGARRAAPLYLQLQTPPTYGQLVHPASNGVTPIPPTATTAPPTATSVPPTATTVPPTSTSTATLAPSTATSTATVVPPTDTNTATAVPPTVTAVPPTATNTATLVPPTATSTATLVPPTASSTATAVPPTVTSTPTTAPPTATSSPTVSNTPTQGLTAIAQTSTATTIPGGFSIGTWVQPTTRINLRSGPSTSSSSIAVLPTAATCQVTGSPVIAGGYTWYPVSCSSYGAGYVAGTYLRQLAAPPAVTRTPAIPATATRTPTKTATPSCIAIFTIGTSTQSTANVNMRTGPGLRYDVVGVVANGSRVTVTGSPANFDGFCWYPVTVTSGSQNGKTGWIAGRYLRGGTTATSTPTAIPGGFTPGTQVQPTTRVNLRSGPSTSSSSIAVLPVTATCQVTGAPIAAGGYTWYPVSCAGYGSGYVAGTYLRRLAAPPTATRSPVVTATITRTPTKTATPSCTTVFGVGAAVQSTANVNMRTGPGLRYGITGVVANGSRATVTGSPINFDGFCWYPVTINSGTQAGKAGWIASRYLKSTTPTATAVPPTRTPVVSPTKTRTPLPSPTPTKTRPPGSPPPLDGEGS